MWSDGLALWLPKKLPEQYKGVWFDYRQNEIIVKNPDDTIIKKMKQIAKMFNVRVQGDDGKEY
jgi:hypothetical protein